jgi:hypothetical protein
MIQKSLATLMLQIKQEFHDDCKSLPKLASTTYFWLLKLCFVLFLAGIFSSVVLHCFCEFWKLSRKNVYDLGEKVTTMKIRTSKTNQNEREHWKICKQSLHRKCLFSSSLLRQKSDFRCSDFTYGVKKGQNVENKKHQLPMAYYLWLPRPMGG